MKRVAVHQPNFFPWCGYFAKMLQCDEFVFFDDVQLPQGRSFVSRVKIAKGTDDEQWLTAPVAKSGGLRRISDASFADEEWRAKHLKTLQHTYARARHFADTMAFVEPLLAGADPGSDSDSDSGASVAEFNMRCIEALARRVGWGGVFHRSSDHPSPSTADARIAELVEAVGGDVYVSGAGGQNYQSEDVYAARGVTLEVRKYAPVAYERSGWPFVGGLSLLDVLFHAGPDAPAALVYS